MAQHNAVYKATVCICLESGVFPLPSKRSSSDFSPELHWVLNAMLHYISLTLTWALLSNKLLGSLWKLPELLFNAVTVSKSQRAGSQVGSKAQLRSVSLGYLPWRKCLLGLYSQKSLEVVNLDDLRLTGCHSPARSG